jgi:hypothetical protein
LKDNPKKFLEKTLMKKPPLKNSGGVFQTMRPPGSIIKNYAMEIGKRVRYHMEKENYDLVSYFLEDMEKLKEILRDDSLETELKNIKKLIEQTLKDKFSKTVSEFNSKIYDYSVEKADITNYTAHVKLIDMSKGYSKVEPDCDWKNKGDDNYTLMMKSIATAFQKERKREEEDDNINQKSLKTLTTLYFYRSF